MLNFPRWKRIWFWAITLATIAAALPSLITHSGGSWPNALPNPTVNLGLDLAGGSHILLEAQPAQVARQRLQTMEESVRDALQNAEPQIHISQVSSSNGQLSFILDDPRQVNSARDVIEPLTADAGLSGPRAWNFDIVDGNRVVMKQTQAALELAVTQAMDSATQVVRKRIDALGTREPTIIRQGNNRIVVQVPGLQDPGELKELLGQTAELEFKLVDQSAQPSEIANGIAPPGSEVVPYGQGTPYSGTSIAVRRLGGIQGASLINAQQSFNPQTNEPVVSITFDPQGSRRFAQLTRENVNRPFAIILDGKVLSAPNINEPILGGSAQISGGFTVEGANQLAIALRSGALPVDLAVVEERTVGPDLGADSISKGLIAMGIGSFLVIALMMASYGRFGVYANLALVLNVLMILGIMAVMNTTLTLPGIAGFVLTIGAAVDANVLIYERIREERRRGRSVISSVETGYREASRAIYDANITNFIAGMLLFMFGSGPVRGFAVVLIIGLFTSVFTGVTMTRMWVASWLRRSRPTSLADMGIIKLVRDNTNIRFLKWRMPFYVVSILLIVASWAAVFTNGLNYGVDFEGGQEVRVTFEQSVEAPIPALREQIERLGYGEPVIQQFGAPNQVSIRVPLPAEAEATPGAATAIGDRVISEIEESYAGVRRDGNDTVSGKVAGEFRSMALYALLAAMAAISLYIWLRFEWQFGVGALFALFHDVSLTMGMFAVFQLEFSLQIIAAILAIIGYSLNDTIVIYDRIRENMKKYRKMPLEGLLDLSVNETLARTVMTSLTLLIALVPLVLMGPDSLFGLAAAITLGIFVGTYSSIYMSAPILIWLGVSADSFVPTESRVDAQERRARGEV